MEFRLLGPVELVVAGQPVAVGPPQRRTVLAALALDAGRLVSTETLIDRVWGDSPPDQGRRALHAHIARIRRLLETAATADELPVELTRRSSGYVLDTDPETVDVHRFRRLLDLARDRGHDDDARVALLREALALWHGDPLASLDGQWVSRTRQGWRQLHLDAVLEWAGAELAVDNPAAVITTLTELVDENPFVEALPALLMRALSAMGRARAALDLYSKVRTRLVAELGTEPGAELRQAHEAILRGEPEPVPRPRRVSPAQLPRDVRGFSGRVDELAELDAMLPGEDEPAGPVVIGVVAGPAGVGKTALAVRWAHRVRHRFPDGQLYVNLRGFDPAESTMDPAEAVRGFLATLQVPPQRIPADPDAQAALYRSELSGRRMLVLLDNAGDTAQVRPLLPGASGSAVVVTSRNQLTGLVAGDGAHSITLDVLSTAHARDLLRNRLGAARLAAEPDAVREIIACCARLPLALTIVAARAVTQPRIPLAALAAELRDIHARLDVLTTDDPATDVRAVFSWSYNDLGPDAARLFRLLGVAPGPDIATPAAAGLAGIPFAAARSLLTELAAANLIVEHAPGRYTFHDLLRAYATSLAQLVDTGEQRRAALHRILDHFVHTGFAAALLLHSGREPISIAAPRSGVRPERLCDLQNALVWFRTEHAVLVTAVSAAIGAGFDTHAWQLAWTLTDFLDRQGYWYDWITTQRIAATAGNRLAEPALESDAHQQTGHALIQLGRFDDAHAHLRQALSLGERAGDHAAQGQARYSFAVLAARQSRHDEALDHARHSLSLFTSAGQRHGQALARNTIGWICAELGDHRQASTQCRQALALFEEIDDQHGQGEAWDRLGLAHHHLGNHPEAVRCYRHALTLLNGLGDRYWVADTLSHLGDTHRTAGDLDAAAEQWRQALSILDELDHPDAEPVRAKLAAIGQA